MYIEKHSETLQENLRIEIGNHRGLLQLEPKNPNLDVFSHIFRQWNGILLQMFNKKETISSEILPFMQRLTTTAVNEVKDKSKNSIRSRIDSKKHKTYEHNLNELLNKVKNILTKDCYASDIQLAEDILSTTVTTDNKYTE